MRLILAVLMCLVCTEVQAQGSYGSVEVVRTVRPWRVRHRVVHRHRHRHVERSYGSYGSLGTVQETKTETGPTKTECIGPDCVSRIELGVPLLANK